MDEFLQQVKMAMESSMDCTVDVMNDGGLEVEYHGAGEQTVNYRITVTQQG